MSQVGDVVRLIDNQIIGQQTMMNVYFYKLISALVSGSDQALSQGFEDTVLPLVSAIQSSTLTHVSLDTLNITNNFDISSEPTGVVGLVTASQLATSQLAYTIKLNRPNANIRNGFKRIAGVPESGINANSVEPATLSALQGIANQMAQNIEVESMGEIIATWQPVLVGRNATGGYDLARVYAFTSATAQNRVTTQNTRKLFA